MYCIRLLIWLGREMDMEDVRAGPPVGVGIGSLPMTPNKNEVIGVLCVESDLVGVGRHNKT